MNKVRANILPIVLGVLGLLLVLVGVFQMVVSSDNNEPLTFKSEDLATEKENLLVVDIEGAVTNPGVYKIAPNSRIVDALAAAGGLSEDADREYVQKNINLAKKATDGLKVYIPRLGEQILSTEVSAAGSVLNVNTASQSELEALPGIGAVTAQKIIEARPFIDVSELTSRKVIGQSVFEKIKDKIAAN